MKRRSLLFAAFAAFAFGPAALAQMTCVASAPNPTFLRSNGLSELAGDIVITCRGGTPVTTGAFPTINLSMFFNSGVTSRVLVPASPGGPGLTEAVLIIDTPALADQRPCIATSRQSNAPAAPKGLPSPAKGCEATLVQAAAPSPNGAADTPSRGKSPRK